MAIMNPFKLVIHNVLFDEQQIYLLILPESRWKNVHNLYRWMVSAGGWPCEPNANWRSDSGHIDFRAIGCPFRSLFDFLFLFFFSVCSFISVHLAVDNPNTWHADIGWEAFLNVKIDSASHTITSESKWFNTCASNIVYTAHMSICYTFIQHDCTVHARCI